MEYKILALDLDGTLTNSQKIITPKTRESINNAIDNGVVVVLASGRPIIGIERLAKVLDLYKKGGYILAYNGGHIIECKSGKTIFQRTIPNELFPDICNCAHQFGVHTLTYDDVGVLAESDTAPYVQKEAYNNGISIHKVKHLESAIKGDVKKFMLVGEPERISKAMSFLQNKFRDRLNIYLSERYFMEVMPIGIEKASALGVLLDCLNIGNEQLMAIGDGLNDIPMLQYAGFSVAMDNAYDETKKVADYITLSNDADGVAIAIDKFILNCNI